jgi:hypothetical protein
MPHPSTLVWIDAREAVIVRWSGDAVEVERLRSDVPAHRHATGHVRYDPAVRHGGGRPQTAGEPHRLEHLKRFVELVADRADTDDDLLIVGPGVVHERLARRVRDLDRSHDRTRIVSCRTAGPATDRQLIARLRLFAGAAPRRRIVGASTRSEPVGKAR